jgi:leucyl-tRNA synthetase
MSKSMFNVVNPDMIVEKYGADTLRLYEMFLGPVEQSKPWDTNGIDGCHRFLKKLWGLFYDREGKWLPEDIAPTQEEEKSLHKLIKKVTGDIEQFSYNTSISAFMIATGELQKCRSKAVLEQLVILIAPFAPFIAEELYHALGNKTSVCDAKWPAFDESKTKDSEITMPVQFCGKTRFTMQIPADASREEVEKIALADERTKKYVEGKQIIKTIVVPGRIINIVIK